MNSILTDDQYGDLGIERDPCWSDQWSKFNLGAIEQYFKDVAHWGPLTRSQVEHLIQGLPPPPREYLDLHTQLQEAHGPLKRLDESIKRNEISWAPTPMELVRWCEANKIELPDDFVMEVLEAQAQPIQLSVGPSWARLPASQSTPKSAPKGRPKTMGPTYEAMQEVAKSYQIQEARLGRYRTVEEVAKYVQSLPLGKGMKVTSIVRRLKSRLAIGDAKRIANSTLIKQSKHSCP